MADDRQSTTIAKESFRSFLAAHAAITRKIDARLRRLDQMNLIIYDVLVTLEYEDDHRLRMNMLAEKMMFSKSGLTRVIDKLEEWGYVERRICDDDNRGYYAVLTKRGQQARLEAWNLLEPIIHSHWSAPLGEEMDLNTLKEGFERVVRHSTS